MLSILYRKNKPIAYTWDSELSCDVRYRISRLYQTHIFWMETVDAEADYSELPELDWEMACELIF